MAVAKRTLKSSWGVVLLRQTRALKIAPVFIALALASCGDKQPASAPPSGDTTTEATKSAAPTPGANAAPPARNRHEYSSREGNVFYYEDADGQLIGAVDLGRLPRDQDYQRMMKKGDRAVQFDGRTFAAVTPGSDVVRVMEVRPREQIFRHLTNVSLSSDAIAAKALRDSLAGRLLYPSEAELNAKAEETNADQADYDPSTTRADDYEEDQAAAEAAADSSSPAH